MPAVRRAARRRVSALGGALLGTGLCDVLAVAGTVDVDAYGVHRESVEDGGGERGVAEIAAPVAQGDVGGHRGGDAPVPSVDDVVERVRGGGLVVALFDLADADVIDDQQVGSRPGFEASWIGAVGEACVQVVEQVDAARVAHGDGLLASAHSEGLEDVALAGAGLAGDHQVFVPAHEVEARELEDEGLVNLRLEVPLERLERLALGQAARVDASSDALLKLVRGLCAEDVIEQICDARAFLSGPGQARVELSKRQCQAEKLEVLFQSCKDGIVGGLRS